MENTHELLTDLGLNEKEIAIYLMLMRVGSAPASLLGKRTGITRSTAQYTCQQLAKKGLISMFPKDNVYLYSPESPKHLLHILERRQAELALKQQRTQAVITELEHLRNPEATIPKVRFFEGMNGLKKVFAEFRDSIDGGEILLYDILPTDFVIDEVLSGIFDGVMAQRNKTNTSMRVIATPSPQHIEMRKVDTQNLRETLLIPEEHMPVRPSDCIIYKDMVYMSVFDKDYELVYVMKSQFIADLQRHIFELAWARAKELDLGVT